MQHRQILKDLGEMFIGEIMKISNSFF